MIRFIFRHFTVILIVIAIAGWAIFYLPTTPAWTVFQLKQAIDARNGDRAAEYVDFDRLVKHAGYEMVKEKTGGGILGEFVGKAAIDIFTKPIAQGVQSWAAGKVNDGDRDLQMPAAATAGAMIFMHRDGDSAWTNFRDNQGREWTVHLRREDGGRWRIARVDNIDRLIEQLEHSEGKDFGPP
ncbi:MAG: DUF2939 domain-containing protein [Candidatus Binataceae bacterium]